MAMIRGLNPKEKVQNPSSTLEKTLKKRTRSFPANSLLMKHRLYYFFSNPPPCLDATPDYLRYIEYQPFVGIDSFATIQECKNHDDAYRHWETQKNHDPKFLIHPQKCVIHEGKYVLIFPNIVTDFNVWVKEHANGQVSDADMWDLLKKIGKNMRYLSTETQSNRPHGNLRQGIGITSDLQVFFLNLRAASHAHHPNDVQALHEFLTSIEPRLGDLAIKQRVQRWMTFLSTSCLKLTPDSTPTENSVIHPVYHNPNHVRLVLNYPSSWDVKDKLRFLANMHKLCTDIRWHNSSNLMDNEMFKTHLYKCHPQWNDHLTGKPSALNEVYQFGVSQENYLNQATGSLFVPTIVIFAHNCVKHYRDRAQNYNNINGYAPGHADHMVSSLTASEILTAIDNKFPHLMENIYQAFHLALASGYTHPNFSITQILTQVM